MPIIARELVKENRLKKQLLDNSIVIEDVNKKEEVEIVIVRFNQPEIENKAIKYVEKTNYPHRLTVIDNYPENISLSKLWNNAIRKSQCKYICLLNSDALVKGDWLEEMMKGFNYDDVAAVGPTTNNCASKQNKGEDFSIQNKNKFCELDFLAGFCMIVRKGIAEFPEEVPFYGNENAWEIEAKRQGYRLLWSMGSYVEHIGGSSIRKDNLRKEGLDQFAEWAAKNTPVLFTTFDRLDYSKKALKVLKESTCGEIIVVDNNSKDGTREWLKKEMGITLILNDDNIYVAGAMNQFLDMTKTEEYVAKVDNDTIVPKDWLIKMIKDSLVYGADIIQAKHPILKETYQGGFDEWVKTMIPSGPLRINNFVGGSAIVMKRKKISKLQEGLGILEGWTVWQKNHPEVIKAFDTSIEVKLLDTEYGCRKKYEKYDDYYRFTGRKNDNKNFKKLDVGSGNWKFDGYVTLDRDPVVGADIVADIEDKIPCEDNTFDEIRCHHILEHIEPENKVKVMSELYRILKPNGILDIEVPNFPSPQSVQDPTHFSFWNSQAFRYFIKKDSLYENFKLRYSQYEVPGFTKVSEELEGGWIFRIKLKK